MEYQGDEKQGQGILKKIAQGFQGVAGGIFFGRVFFHMDSMKIFTRRTGGPEKIFALRGCGRGVIA
jgi:hypothetical protein